MKFNAYPEKQELVEIGQPNKLLFSFVNRINDDEVTAVHPFVKCREYFNEFLMKNHHPDKVSMDTVHGFEYDHSRFPYDLSKTRLVIKFNNKEQRDIFLNNIPFLHNIERANGLELTETTLIHKPQNHVLIEGDKFWVSLCLYTNIYTMVLKWMSLDVCSYETFTQFLKTNVRYPEVQYVDHLTEDQLEGFFKNLAQVQQIPHTYVDLRDVVDGLYTIHGVSGIHSLTHRYGTHPKKRQFLDLLKNVQTTCTNFLKVSPCVVDATPVTAS